jgi:hypothetical protein
MMPLLLTSLAPTPAFIGPRRNRANIRTLLIYGAGICVLVSALVVPFLTGNGTSHWSATWKATLMIDAVKGEWITVAIYLLVIGWA